VFEVSVGGKLVFSKKKEGRFPESDEVMGAIESRL
jgi:selT/selW/selH-like putative selenoprotein